ncbi:hypothetical protein IHQ71_10610 [Rhizobium sp. TH2]|uniref:hypothetical protein n=1 Tax=Rhizobium sp. TH2 TaxID=2775403 RepID=UPI0021579AF1|nr:hypothetical protein [Rhizobium sp. TH2]UVC10988.1 hypothetical protein IHQ71_10610 [Rhizobium sp. TH2]
MADDDKKAFLQDEHGADPGIDHDPALGDPEDPADDPATRVHLDGGLPPPMSEVSGDQPDPSTVNQLPVTGGVNWQSPTDPVGGYDEPRERPRASELPRDVVPNGR